MKVFFYPTSPKGWSKTSVILDHLGWEYGTEDDHDLRALFSNRSYDLNGIIIDRKGRRSGSNTQLRPQTINSGCLDVTKSRTDKVFTQAFGYSSLVDPLNMDCVEKTEIQAVKGVRKVKAGTQQRPNHIYQRDIDSRTKEGEYVDLRTMMIGHKVFAVIEKRKPHWVLTDYRTTKTSILPVEAVYSKAEIAKLERMSQLFGCDFADFDVLRDRSGLIYVVDVNYTAHRNSFEALKYQYEETGYQKFVDSCAQQFEAVFSSPQWLVR